MIDLKRCRELLGYGDGFSDEDILRIRAELTDLANFGLSSYADICVSTAPVNAVWTPAPATKSTLPDRNEK